MVKVILGLKGSGKTKKLIDSINSASELAKSLFVGLFASLFGVLFRHSLSSSPASSSTK